MDPLKKVIISTGKLRKAGFKIVHDDISYIEHKASGYRSKMYEKNGVYVIPLWIKGIREPEEALFPGQVKP